MIYEEDKKLVVGSSEAITRTNYARCCSERWSAGLSDLPWLYRQNFSKLFNLVLKPLTELYGKNIYFHIGWLCPRAAAAYGVPNNSKYCTGLRAALVASSVADLFQVVSQLAEISDVPFKYGMDLFTVYVEL